MTFEAAARLTSFTKAATELNVTQGAVSRQISALEDHIGIKLFNRVHRGVQLTHEGRRLFRAVSAGFQHVLVALAEMHGPTRINEVWVETWPIFSQYWLVPRLGRLQHALPDLHLHVVANRDLRLSEPGLDVAIGYGTGRWSGFNSVFMFHEEVFPVASPAYLKKRRKQPAEIDPEVDRLLIYEPADLEWLTWQEWFEKIGQPLGTRAPKSNLYFKTYINTVQAAIEGHGVALGWKRLIDAPLKERRLVRLGTASLKATESYYALTPIDRPVSSATQGFIDWLAREAHSPI